MKVDGKIYGVPGIIKAVALYYNKDKVPTPPKTTDELLKDYPDLEVEDIRACLAYAHAVIARDSLSGVQVTAD